MSRNRRPRRFRPAFDVLEDRSLPAVVLTPIDPLPPILVSRQSAPALSRGAAVALPQFGSEAALTQYLINDALARYRNLFGQPTWHWWGGPWLEDGVVAFAGTSAAVTGDFSSTNVQVQGVDEGDLVKTDGRYIYALAGQELVILQARPASALHVVSRTAVEGSPTALYLDGDRITVLSQVWSPWLANTSSLVLRPYSSLTKVTVFDVSNRAAPRTAQETYADGYVLSSRAVGDRVYLVVQNNFAVLPAPLSRQVGAEWVYETQDEYLARIAGHEIELVLPHFYTRPDGPDTALQSGGFLTDPASVYQPQSFDDTSLISVLTFDVNADSPGPSGAASAYTGYGTTVYATANHLYVVSPRWSDGNSSISQFALDGDHVDLAAAGVVPGRVLDQFALDEDGGYLRVATTVGWGRQGSNGVYVLAPQDGVLAVVGSLEGLAAGETIRSVRFVGDRAYVVTFLSRDPLFILDLSDPAAPHVVGELQLPGYSSYLQPLDATHLLGIGRDGDFALKIALFDVSDPTAPRLVDEYVISSRNGTWPWGTSSLAEFDPHALSYFPETHTLAVPVSTNSYFWWGGIGVVRPLIAWPFGYQPEYESSLEVFRVDPDTGFTFLGRIAQDSPVRRSLRIGNTLYSVATESVEARPLDDPSAPGTEARLTDRPRSFTPILQSAVAGRPIDGEVLEFTIDDPTGLTVTVDWGDCESSPGEVVALGGGRYAVRATYSYDDAGSYYFSVSFSRAGTPLDGGWFGAWVKVSEPIVGPWAPPGDGEEGTGRGVASVTLAPPSDPEPAPEPVQTPEATAAPEAPAAPFVPLVIATTPQTAEGPAQTAAAPVVPPSDGVPAPSVSNPLEAPSGVSPYDHLGGSGQATPLDLAPGGFDLGGASDAVPSPTARPDEVRGEPASSRDAFFALLSRGAKAESATDDAVERDEAGFLAAAPEAAETPATPAVERGDDGAERDTGSPAAGAVALLFGGLAASGARTARSRRRTTRAREEGHPRR